LGLPVIEFELKEQEDLIIHCPELKGKAPMAGRLFFAVFLYCSPACKVLLAAPSEYRKELSGNSCNRNKPSTGHGNAPLRLLTRRGIDWTSRYPSIAAVVAALSCRSCLIDGEVVICGEDGIPVFDQLRYGRQPQSEAVLFAFDLLELGGKDLRRAPSFRWVTLNVPSEVRKSGLVRSVIPSWPTNST
jgi:hypothetical protein